MVRKVSKSIFAVTIDGRAGQSNCNESFYYSRLPDQTMQSYDRLSGPATTYGYPELPLSGPYGQMYPQDELSRIKMRNRRFMNACAMEMGMGQGMGMGMGGPMMMMPPPTQMMMPGLDADLATDELGVSNFVTKHLL